MRLREAKLLRGLRGRPADRPRFSSMFRWIIRMVMITLVSKLVGKYLGTRGARPPR